MAVVDLHCTLVSYAYERSNLTHADNMYVMARVHYRIMLADKCLHCNLCEALRVCVRLELTLLWICLF